MAGGATIGGDGFVFVRSRAGNGMAIGAGGVLGALEWIGVAALVALMANRAVLHRDWTMDACGGGEGGMACRCDAA